MNKRRTDRGRLQLLLIAAVCFGLATGGLLPDGADAVVMHEHTVPVDSKVVEIIKPVGSGANLIRKGDDIKKGAVAVQRGQLLRPQAVISFIDIPKAPSPAMPITGTSGCAILAPQIAGNP